jgi:ACR3 family arsenite efflux pump ArsB
MEQTRRRLSVRDEAKPFVLIGAIVTGVAVNRAAHGRLTGLSLATNIGLFLVIFAIMAFVDPGDVKQAFGKVKPTALALTTNFVFTPLFAWTLGWLLLRHHPDLWAGVILYTLTPCIGWYLIFIDLAEGDVPWGVALLPWNLALQIVLLPLYLWLLVGKVLPTDALTLFGSVALYLFAPLAAAIATRRLLIRVRGREWTYGPYKRAISELKLWALVLLIIGIFASQPALGTGDLGRVGLIVLVTIIFFVGLFLIGLSVGRVFHLGYADTATLVFTTTARNSESVIGIAAGAFAGHPLVLVAILIGPIVELPALLALSRIMLQLREKLIWPIDPGGTAVTIASPSHRIASAHDD